MAPFAILFSGPQPQQGAQGGHLMIPLAIEEDEGLEVEDTLEAEEAEEEVSQSFVVCASVCLWPQENVV